MRLFVPECRLLHRAGDGANSRRPARRKANPLAVKRLGRPGLHADGNGLHLRISEGGGGAWHLFVHVQGKRREMGLGSVKLYNLAEARERDKEAATNAAALASRRTFKECAVEYIALHEARWRNAKFKKD